MLGKHSRSSLPLNDIEDSSDTSSESDGTSNSVSNTQSDTTNRIIQNFNKELTELLPSQKKRKKRKVLVCLTNCKYDVVRRTVNKFSYKEVGDAEPWNLYWTDLSISIERCKEMKRYQRINHFPGMLEICRKDLLARNLNRMQRIFPKEYNFFPRTWCLPADLGEALAYSRLKKNKTFILKPDAGCQGRGIYITKTLKDVKPSERMVCQVYITRPFLIDGYKFDLRVYTLITSCDPLRIYVYKEGLCRFATSRYKEPSGLNINNVFMHLTNYAVNKHSRTFNFDNEIGSKRKLSWFGNYLRTLGHDVEKLWQRIDDLIIKTIICSWPVLKHSYMACFPNHDVVPACCELLGTDVILDKRLNPQLLEINHSPSFHTDTKLDCEVKEALLEDMFNMLNLQHCDKKKIIKEDKKRIRDRLLHGTNKDNVNEPRSFSDYSKHEMANRGHFRLVYPTPHSDKLYERLFNQGQGSLYCDTVCSRARESAQTALRDEIVLKAKVEAAKRATPLKTTAKPKSHPPSVEVSKNSIRPSTHPVKNSFQPQIIVDSEEKDRLLRLAQRDFLVRSYGLMETIYFSLKKNGVLRPQDEMKFSVHTKPSSVEKSKTSKRHGPAITDLLEGIKNREIHSSGVNAMLPTVVRGHTVGSFKKSASNSLILIQLNNTIF
ncbi:hypothetical protein FQA39_LY01680 [Lamprigera yunnana]|nr:hypothetical protein FQA39_LY01680 [Lamprigera yunnana]